MAEAYDAVVIGGGSGGLAFAKSAARLGAKVALVERDALGGTCTNRGCVPKKLMWYAARTLRHAKGLVDRNVTTQAEFNFAALQEQIADHIAEIRESFEDSLEMAGAALIRGEATVPEAGVVRVDGADLQTDNVVLAVGGHPARIDIPGADLTQTSTDVMGWTELPTSIAVLGGGYIGVELASILQAMGVEAHIIDPSPRLLTGFDADGISVVEDLLRERGIRLTMNETPTRVEQTTGGLQVTLESGKTVQAACVLNATGRTPNLDALGAYPKEAKRAVSGALAIDGRFETSQQGLFAVGDCADRLPLTPVATADGNALAHILYGQGSRPIDLDRVAQTAFVFPPIAQVGTVRQAKGQEGAPLPCGALFDEETTFHKLGFGADGALTGAVLIDEAAPDLIGAMAIALGTPRAAFTETEAVHPSFVEEFSGRT